MCTGGDGVPGSVGEALGMLDASLDYLNGPAGRSLEAAALGEALRALAAAGAKYSAAWNGWSEVLIRVWKSLNVHSGRDVWRLTAGRPI